jgi:short-subunit dehydrogenase
MTSAVRQSVTVITGASSGIGRALALELARQGHRLGLIARRREELERVADEIRALGGHAEFAPADVTDRAQVLAAFESLTGRLGPVDLLVANSGRGGPTRVEPQHNTAETEDLFRVNVFGVVYCIEAVLPAMVARKQGHIAAVASVAAFKGMPGYSAYCASKAAVVTYMEGLRIQLRRRGVHVTTICPGFVRTPMTAVNKFPMPFLIDADKAARLIATALRRKKKVYAFPWRMARLMRLMYWAPDSVLAKVLRSTYK